MPSPPELDEVQNNAVHTPTVQIADVHPFIHPPIRIQAHCSINTPVSRLRVIPLLCCIILVTVTSVVYSGVRDGAFQYDDFYSILINHHLDRWATFVGHLDHM